MILTTACPLDCYDACSITVDTESLKLAGNKEHPFTNGALCPHLNIHIKEAKRIKRARIGLNEVSMDEALLSAANAIKSAGEEFLLYRGSGNMGVMQRVLEHFTAKAGGWTTNGSLCDGSGEFGIAAGRGVSLSLPIESIKESEVVVVWGRNITVTNHHMARVIKDKTIIVIDPIKIRLTKESILFLQICPRGDFYLAIALAKLIYEKGLFDSDFVRLKCENVDKFIALANSFSLSYLLKKCDLQLKEVEKFLEIITSKKSVFLVGAGVQKYSIGSFVTRAIDAVAALLGLFGKSGCGVSFLADSTAYYNIPFSESVKKVPKPTAPFGNFKTVLIQGANPLAQMPGLKVVNEQIKRVENIIYFGLYENETSSIADIVIPAKSFLSKSDFRLSYGHKFVEPMPKIYDEGFGISEYEFAKYLFKEFSLEGLEHEEYYINSMIEQSKKDGKFLFSPAYVEQPYLNGFYTDSRRFIFLDSFEDDFSEDDGFWLITPKSSSSLNSQFRRERLLYIHPSHGIEGKQKVRVISKHGEIVLEVKTSLSIKKGSVLIYSSTCGLNYLTPPIKSSLGNSSCYQDVKVKLEILK